MHVYMRVWMRMLVGCYILTRMGRRCHEMCQLNIYEAYSLCQLHHLPQEQFWWSVHCLPCQLYMHMITSNCVLWGTFCSGRALRMGRTREVHHESEWGVCISMHVQVWDRERVRSKRSEFKSEEYKCDTVHGRFEEDQMIIILWWFWVSGNLTRTTKKGHCYMEC